MVEELTHRTGGTRATRLIKQSINRFNSELYFNLFSFKLSENLNLSWTSDLSSHLLSIDGVQRLVEEQTQSAQEGRPPGSLQIRIKSTLQGGATSQSQGVAVVLFSHKSLQQTNMPEK